MSEYKRERLKEIIKLVHAAGEGGITRKQIADGMKIKVTPYLVELISLLSKKGLILKSIRQMPPRGGFVWFHYATDKLNDAMKNGGAL